MAIFDIHTNPDGRTKRAIPYVLELQSGLLSDLDTRVVAPLVPAQSYRGAVPRLNPTIAVDGVPHILLAQQLAAIPKRSLASQPIGNAEDGRYEIIAAIDFLVTGI